MVNPEGDIKQEGIKVDEDIDLTFDYGELTKNTLAKTEKIYPKNVGVKSTNGFHTK